MALKGSQFTIPQGLTGTPLKVLVYDNLIQSGDTKMVIYIHLLITSRLNIHFVPGNSAGCRFPVAWELKCIESLLGHGLKNYHVVIHQWIFQIVVKG